MMDFPKKVIQGSHPPGKEGNMVVVVIVIVVRQETNEI